MSTKVAVESPPASVARRQPLLKTTENAPKNVRRRGSKMGEAAGECAAVCCCCPCAMTHLLILVAYRLPREIWRKKKRRILLRKRRRNSSGENEVKWKISSPGFPGGDDDDDDRESTDETAKNDAVEWDDEVWDRFGAGFWRSDSQRMDD